MSVIRDQMLRYAVIVMAALAYLGHGGQTHLSFAQSETVSVLICGDGIKRTVEMTFGDTSPPEVTSAECCADCTSSPAPPVPSGTVYKHPHPLPVRMGTTRPLALSQLGGPLWPGAPPHGPPATHLI